MRRSVDEHLQAVLERIAPLPPFDQSLLDALGLVLCEDVTSPISLPSFDNSSMDGYAVRAADLAGASEQAPVQLPVMGDIAAGRSRPLVVTPGTVVRIMTGAPLPRGADAVVPMEWTDGGSVSVRIARQPQVGNSIRRVAEDLHAGTKVLDRDTPLGPRQIAILAAVGRSRVMVRPRPRVVIVSTGAELREPGGQLEDGQIYDSNSYTLAAAKELTEFRRPVLLVRAADDRIFPAAACLGLRGRATGRGSAGAVRAEYGHWRVRASHQNASRASPGASVSGAFLISQRTAQCIGPQARSSIKEST